MWLEGGRSDTAPMQKAQWRCLAFSLQVWYPPFQIGTNMVRANLAILKLLNTQHGGGAGGNTALSYPSHTICSLTYQPGLICSY